MHPRDSRDVARLPRAPSPRRGDRCGLSTSDRWLSRFLCGFSSAFNRCRVMKRGAPSLAKAAAARGDTRAHLLCAGGPCYPQQQECWPRGQTWLGATRCGFAGNPHHLCFATRSDSRIDCARAGRTPGTILSAAETDEDRIPVPTHASLGANRSAIPGAALFDGGLPVCPAKVRCYASGCLTPFRPACAGVGFLPVQPSRWLDFVFAKLSRGELFS